VKWTHIPIANNTNPNTNSIPPETVKSDSVVIAYNINPRQIAIVMNRAIRTTSVLERLQMNPTMTLSDAVNNINNQ